MHIGIWSIPENMLMPLSVFMDDHLFVSRREDDDECGSGIERECRIDPPGKHYLHFNPCLWDTICSYYLPILDPSLPIPMSYARIRCISGQGDTVPGDRCGVKSFQTRCTCWSKIDWSLSSSGCSFFNIASVSTCPGCPLPPPVRWNRGPSIELVSTLYIFWSNRSLLSLSRCSSSSLGMSSDNNSFWLGGLTDVMREVSGTTTYEFVSGFMWIGWSGWSRDRRGWVRPSLR